MLENGLRKHVMTAGTKKSSGVPAPDLPRNSVGTLHSIEPGTLATQLGQNETR
jgi:hypothetical protein